LSDIKSLTFEELERKFTPLITKFSRYAIPGMGPDDIAQELRLVLAKAQRNYDPSRGESGFLHYLYRAFENRMGQLAYKPQAQKRVPLAAQVPLDDVDVPGAETGFERVELEAGLGRDASRLVGLVLDRDITSRRGWREHLGERELGGAIRELRQHLGA